MATVYLAKDPSFDRQVAMKVLPLTLMHDPQFRARFEREARTIATLEHQAIVPVFDYGEENDQPYLVMRYLPGNTLRDRMKTGRFSLQEAQYILNRFAPALDKAHRRGIVHRDLKPENILFDEDGEAYISDFGIAKLAESQGNLTGSGIIGTPAYMSPEQALGRAEVDGRSDQYSLVVMLFEMLTGKALFKADTPMGLALAHLNQPPPSILAFREDLPNRLESVFETALAKQPENRYTSVSDLAKAFAQDAGMKSAAVAPTTQRSAENSALHSKILAETGVEEERGKRRHLFWNAALLIGLIVIGFVALAKAFLNGDQPPATSVNSEPTITPANPPESLASELPVLTATNISQLSASEFSTIDGVAAMAWMPDSRHLVANLMNDDLVIYSIVDSTQRFLDTAAFGYLEGVSVNSDGTLVAASGYSTDVGIWNAASGDLEDVLVLTSPPDQIAFSVRPINDPIQTDYLITSNYDLELEVWDSANGQSLGLHPIGPHKQFLPSPYGAYAYIEDSGGVVFGSNDEVFTTIRLPDYGTLEIDGVPLSATNFVFSPDGELLAVADNGGFLGNSDDSSIKLWSTQSGQLEIALSPQISGWLMDFNPAGDLLAAATYNSQAQVGEIYIWNVDTGELLAVFTFADELVRILKFSPDGRLLAIGTAPATSGTPPIQLQLWQVPLPPAD